MKASLPSHMLMGDFRAFYCAGELAREGRFDYSLDRIAPCESRPVPAPFFSATRKLAVPAPLPGYAIAPFAVLSLLPYAAAAVLWWIALFATAVSTAVALARLKWSAFGIALLALALPVGLVCMPLGELPPFALAGIAMCALGMRSDRPALRAAGFALLCSQPQLAVAAAIAMICAVPKSWREVAAVAVALAALSLVTIGVSQNVAYVRDFLPAHVASEVVRVQQYTLSWALAEIGVSFPIAIAAGRVAYGIALVLAGFFALRLSAADEKAAACAVGVVLALFGGPFVHQDHIACAVPAALWLASRKIRAGIVAVVLFALPVASIFANPVLVPLVAVCSFSISRAYRASMRVSGYSSLGAMAATVCLALLSVRLRFAFHSAAHGAGVWASYVSTHNVVGGALIWIIKAPVWIALLLVSIGAFQLATRYEGRPGTARIYHRGG
ncbi:MAG: hypothetical protein M3R51_10410 [Candidatus Eremiobacteraeota bacterium]|nr:hypothetical protein [Candidatus Eremiobacteraeota bacterium]